MAVLVCWLRSSAKGRIGDHSAHGRRSSVLQFEGQVAIVTGAVNGIGRYRRAVSHQLVVHHLPSRQSERAAPDAEVLSRSNKCQPGSCALTWLR